MNRALDAPRPDSRSYDLALLEAPPPLPFWGGDDVEAVVELPDAIYIAGGFGVARLERAPSDDSRFQRVDISAALPTRRVAAFTAWRTDLVAGTDAGGLFVRHEGDWSELRSPYGTLHVRDLKESAAGELWVGAREGLFRLPYGERSIARLHSQPVKAIALDEGGRVLSGGEKGLLATQGPLTSSIPVADPEKDWIDDLDVAKGRTFVATPKGLFASNKDGSFHPVQGADTVSGTAVVGSRLFAAAAPSESALRSFDQNLKSDVIAMSAPVRRVFAVRDRLFVDTADGLFERANDRFRLVVPRINRIAESRAHVGAIAAFKNRIVVGFFDGGLAELRPDALSLEAIGGAESSSVWAVNALMSSGGALHVASLRGASRYDGKRFTPMSGPGAAFSLAQTGSGVAIGYGEGVLLPDQKLLSGFHGLPGNQATALSPTANGLLVGTPSGLGYVAKRSVLWRVASGEGKLPHPWVTAILMFNDSVFVGTYGGGLARRTGPIESAAKGEWRHFSETAGAKINTGCLIASAGRVYAGTDGAGLLRLSKDGSRFERLKLSLPSPRITALFEKDGFLYIGTDEGLTRWVVGRVENP